MSIAHQSKLTNACPATRAELVAQREGFQFVEAPAIWRRGGEVNKGAGFARNAVIVDIADRFAFFWDGKSKGTKHAIDLVREVPKPLIVLYSDLSISYV